jgi:hypothetical protein
MHPEKPLPVEEVAVLEEGTAEEESPEAESTGEA